VTWHVNMQVCVCSSGLLASSSFRLSLLGLFPQNPARGAIPFALRTVRRRRVQFHKPDAAAGVKAMGESGEKAEHEKLEHEEP
jgi:hypothetical protein